jgi:hypothetical protein
MSSVFELCPPSLIYLIFSATQIIIDTIKGLYNTAFFKLIVAFMVTLLLNALCKQGLGVISWIIVFIPFLMMSVIISLLLYIFGLDAAKGPNKNKNQPPPKNQPPNQNQNQPPNQNQNPPPNQNQNPPLPPPPVPHGQSQYY